MRVSSVRLRSIGAILLFALPSIITQGLALAGQTSVNDHFVASSADADARLYVRERLPAGADPKQLEKAVLFVHGATYPGATFDLELDGYDWMTQVAMAGFAAYALDMRGYGRSTRPAAMADPPEKNAPFSRAKDAVADVGDAVEFILDRTGADRVDLIGWSWGTMIAGMYAAEHGDKVDKLVLYAPIYSLENPDGKAWLADPGNQHELKPLGAYRTVGFEQTGGRWASQIVPEDKSQWRDEKVLQTWFEALLATEPEGAEVVRAPNGVLVDLWEVFHARPLYDAGRIEAPTLIIRGDADGDSTHEDAFGLFEQLGSEDKQYIVIGDATHFLSLEKRAPMLTRQVQVFLED
jgi:pimeloyl-ACP methyl ester carboxylesterase